MGFWEAGGGVTTTAGGGNSSGSGLLWKIWFTALMASCRGDPLNESSNAIAALLTAGASTEACVADLWEGLHLLGCSILCQGVLRRQAQQRHSNGTPESHAPFAVCTLRASEG